MIRPYWLSWWDDVRVDFQMRWPWWATHCRIIQPRDMPPTQQYSITAAVMAISSEDAKSQIVEAYAFDVELEWLFVEAQPLGWSPFSAHRPRSPAMIWDQRPH